MTRSTAAPIVAIGVTALAAVLSWPAYRFAQAARPAQEVTPTAPVTPTLTITPTTTSTATRTPVATDTATPTLTPTATRTPAPTATATPTYEWVYLHVDDALRVQLCDELAPGGAGTTPPPLIGCTDVAPWREAPPIAAPGQQYILWPGPWRYRVYIDATATPVPGWCQPVYIVVTATPTATDTPTPTATADWIATAVAGTLTALAPTPTGTPRPADTRRPTPLPEATPTPSVWRLTLFPLLNRRPIR